MPQPKKRPASKQTPAKPQFPALPEVSTARLEEAMRLVEDVVSENQSVFVQKANDYREVHREGTSRPLNATEAAQIHAALVRDEVDGRDPGAQIAELQQSELRAYDPPAEQEVLMAAGVATAPAFMSAVKRFCVLIEMPDPVFREAHQAGEETLDQAIEEAVTALDYLSVEKETRPRTVRALEHFSKAVGAESGKGLALMAQAVMQALTQAMSASPSQSPTSSLVDSAADTDGHGQRSSTTSPTETPSPT